MPMDWTHVGPTIVAAFLASTVECIEALTVVLAVGTVRGWRSALLGTSTAVGVLLLVVAGLGSVLTHIPLGIMQLVIGALLLLFGMRWLHKAILRSAGVIARHDETQVYAREQNALQRTTTRASGRADSVAFALAFKSVILEGMEVVFIVTALAAGDSALLWPAGIGAFAALIVVVALGVVVRRPLARIPENTLKFLVGVLLSAFGTFWIGEGLHFGWLGRDWAIVGLIAGYLAVAVLATGTCRRYATNDTRNTIE